MKIKSQGKHILQMTIEIALKQTTKRKRGNTLETIL